MNQLNDLLESTLYYYSSTIDEYFLAHYFARLLTDDLTVLYVRAADEGKLKIAGGAYPDEKIEPTCISDVPDCYQPYLWKMHGILVEQLSKKQFWLIDDNHQFAFSHGKLYSFDYAISFCVDERTFGAMCILNDYHIPSTNFRNNFRLGNYCYKAIDLLERKSDESKKFLQDAYIDTLLRFFHTDPAKFQPIWNDLNAAFKPVIADFYRTCIEERMKALNAMLVT